MRFRIAAVLAFVAGVTLSVLSSRAQIQTGAGGVVGGVAITTDGLLQIPRTAVPRLPLVPGKATLVYISLPRLFADARALIDAGKPLTPEIRTLHGLTQIHYVFAYPDAHDLVIAGPAETVRMNNPLQPVGAATGRPTLQFDDLAVVFRCVLRGGDDNARGPDFFGCSLEPSANDVETARALVARYGTDRPRLLAEMKKAIGPQQVQLFGVPNDSRVALAMVAADYRLKRLSMGLDMVPGLGTGLGQQGSSRFWFRPSYDPIQVSADGWSYAFHGPRLQVSVGRNGPDGGPVPKNIERFCEQFSQKTDQIAARVEAVADLQNITDLFLLATLIRADGLADKTALDLSWLLDPQQFHVGTVPAPRTAETLVTIAGDELARGGVAIASRSLGRTPRGNDGGAALVDLRRRPTDAWFVTVPLSPRPVSPPPGK
jgi:hypothetical protein